MRPPGPNTSESVSEADAARALDAGSLVLAPTDTVLGVFARGDLPGARQRLAAALQQQTRPLLAAWHAGSVGDLEKVFDLTAPLHARVAGQLLPGPLTLAIEPALFRGDAPPGSIAEEDEDRVDPGLALARVPDAPPLCELISAAGGPVIGVAAGAVRDDAELIACDLGGWKPSGEPSSRVRLLAPGGYRVEHEGALSSDEIHRRVTRTVVFVCTGNTCRSPMAERIAIDLLRSASDSGNIPGVEILSAGVATGGGSPPSEEIWEALEAAGIDPERDRAHRSQPLTLDLLRRAEAVFTMTEEHLFNAAAIDRRLAPRIQTLDPSGAPIPDPIGLSQSVYDETALRMKTLITQRLRDLGLLPA